MDAVEEWKRRRAEAIASGERPIFGSICPTCYHLIPRDVERRSDLLPNMFCGCGNVVRAAEDYSAHGLPPSDHTEKLLKVVE